MNIIISVHTSNIKVFGMLSNHIATLRLQSVFKKHKTYFKAKITTEYTWIYFIYFFTLLK